MSNVDHPPRVEQTAPVAELERFLAKRQTGAPTECWEWTGCRSRGYGFFRADGRTVRAHRYAWEMANGARIPTGLGVLHSCDNPPCCNPAHLSVGTQRDNMQDAMGKGRLRVITQCTRGHEYTPANTYTRPNGQRECVECRRLNRNHLEHDAEGGTGE